MAIILQKPGMADIVAGAGAIVGKSEAIKRENEQQFQMAAEERAKQWELEKATMRSMQDFEQEQKQQQFENDKINAARQWDLQKMTLNSQLDFDRAKQEEDMKFQRTLKRKSNALSQMDAELKSLNEAESLADRPDIRAQRELQIRLRAQVNGGFESPRDVGIIEQTLGEKQFNMLTQDQQQQAAGIAAGTIPSADITARLEAEKNKPQGEGYNDAPWYMNPKYYNTPEAIKVKEGKDQTGSVPWYVEYSQEKHKGTELYEQARAYLSGKNKTPTYKEIAEEMDAYNTVKAMLSNYTKDVLDEFGVNTKAVATPDFSGGARGRKPGTAVNLPRPTTQEEYNALQTGQHYIDLGDGLEHIK